MEVEQMDSQNPIDINYARIVNLPQAINMVLVVMISSGILVAVALYLAKASLETILSILALIVACIVLFIANRKGYNRFAAFGAFLSICGVLTYNMARYNGIYDVSLIAFPATIVFSSLLLGYQFVPPIVLTVLLLLTGVYKLSIAGITTPYDGRILTQSQDFWTVIAAIIITGLLVQIIMSLVEQNVRGILRSEARLHKAYESTLQGWSKALELRDRETDGHSKRVTELTVRLAKMLFFSEEELKYARWGALLHDIGKMSIPDAILLKPGKLNDEEFQIIKKHPETAKSLLENIPYLEPALVIPQFHHERWDGSGYPYGLKGKDIPLPGRIFAVIDVWDALLSKRPYKKAWSKEEALNHLREKSGILFDPEIVDAFSEIVE